MIGRTKTSTQKSKSVAPGAQTEADKKAERLAKLEAWKKKIAEDKERKEKEHLQNSNSQPLSSLLP